MNYVYSKDLVSIFSKLTVGLRIFLTLPITVNAERIFSELTKNYLHMMMSQERLVDLAIISTELDITSTLNYSHAARLLFNLKLEESFNLRDLLKILFTSESIFILPWRNFRGLL
jgi:hypothetical protein